MNREKAEFFDGQVDAPWAAEEYGADERPRVERLLREAELKHGQWVLEPGCGTGRLSLVLAEVVGGQGRVVAMDISAGMTQACVQRVKHLDHVEVYQAAVEQYQAPEAGFDRIICHQVFPHFDDKPLALEIMRGMLKPGGVLAVVHFRSAEEINDTHRKAGTVVEKDMLPGDEQMRALIADAGLDLEMLVDDELGYFLRARLPA